MRKEKKNNLITKYVWGYFLIIICLFTTSCISDDENIRVDGYYQEEMEKSTSLLRFYKDGTVIAVSTSGKMEEISSWFTKENNREIGKYQIDGSNISFSTISPWGEAKYAGTVNSDKSILDLSVVRYDFIDDKNKEYKTERKFVNFDFTNNSKNNKPKNTTIKEVVYYNDYKQPRLALLLNKAGQVILKKTYEPMESLNVPLIRYTDILTSKKITLPNEWLLMDINGDILRDNSNKPVLLDHFDGDINSSVEFNYWNPNKPWQKTSHQRTILKYDGVISKDIGTAVFIWKM